MSKIKDFFSMAKIKEFYSKNGKFKVNTYIILRALVLICLILQIMRGDWQNVFFCILTLVLFTIPYFVDKTLNITLPTLLEDIILLFIFSAEILGEIQNFYGIFPYWDTMLHTINGFLCAAIGFALIDILNRNDKFLFKCSPLFVAIVAFCFSMTVGVLWEFFEYTSDHYFLADMQRDSVIQEISSAYLHPQGLNKPIIIENIDHTVIYYQEDGEMKTHVIEGGYMDIGIIDTMEDLFVNFIGAIVFSIIGLLYIKDRDEYHYLENFLPRLKPKKRGKKKTKKVESTA